jgi:hypothetical protein
MQLKLDYKFTVTEIFLSPFGIHEWNQASKLKEEASRMAGVKAASTGGVRGVLREARI